MAATDPSELDINKLTALWKKVPRSATTPIDDAKNQAKLSKLGFNNTQIAVIHGITSARVGQLAKALTLSPKIRKKIHNGEIALDAALVTASMSHEATDSAFNQAEKMQKSASRRGSSKQISGGTMGFA